MDRSAARGRGMLKNESASNLSGLRGASKEAELNQRILKEILKNSASKGGTVKLAGTHTAKK